MDREKLKFAWTKLKESRFPEAQMFYYQCLDYNQAEIAEKLNISPATVSNVLPGVNDKIELILGVMPPKQELLDALYELAGDPPRFNPWPPRPIPSTGQQVIKQIPSEEEQPVWQRWREAITGFFAETRSQLGDRWADRESRWFTVAGGAVVVVIILFLCWGATRLLLGNNDHQVNNLPVAQVADTHGTQTSIARQAEIEANTRLAGSQTPTPDETQLAVTVEAAVNDRLTAVAAAMPTGTPTNTPVPSATPPPTNTATPTETPTETLTPSVTPTPAELFEGDGWDTGLVSLTMTDHRDSPWKNNGINVIRWPIGFLFELNNHSGEEIRLDFYSNQFTMIDDKGTEYGCDIYNSSSGVDTRRQATLQNNTNYTVWIHCGRGKSIPQNVSTLDVVVDSMTPSLGKLTWTYVINRG